MPFLRINGWTIPISASKATRAWKRSGDRVRRTARGSTVDSRRNLRRTWECEACFLNPDDADGLINLLSGSGHYFDLFDGFAASTGLQPTQQPINGARFRPTMAGIDDALGGFSFSSDGELARIDAGVSEHTILLSVMKENKWVTGAIRDDGLAYEEGKKSKSFGVRGRWTNLVPRSNDWLSPWSFSGGVTQTSVFRTSPTGAASTLLTKSTTTTSTGCSITLSSVAFTVVTVSIYVRKGTAANTSINLYDATAVANRHIVELTWNAGSAAPSVASNPSAAGGHIFDVEDAGEGWYRVSFTAENIVPANANQLYIYPAGLGSSTGTVEVSGAQVENAFVPGPYVKTNGSSTTGPKEIYFEVNDGMVSVAAESGPFVVDDLIILPWRASESQMAAWTVRGSRWGPLPLLRIDGDILEGSYDSSVFGSTLVVGDVLGIDFIQKPTTIPGIGWVNNAKIVRFQLGEVDETFKQAQSYRSNSGFAPPGSPVIRYDGSNIDGAGNQTLSNGSSFVSWRNTGSLYRVQDTGLGGATYRERVINPALASTLNHTPGAAFNGTSQYLRAPPLNGAVALSQTPNIWIACLAISDSTASTRYVYDSASLSSVYRWRQASPGTMTFVKGNTVTYSGVSFVSGRALLSIARLRPTTTSLYKVSGGTIQSLATGGLTTTFFGLTVGASNAATPAFFWLGRIVELLVWKTDEDLFESIEEYFHRRYGVLPQTG